MLVLNTLDPDPRVWREAESLSCHGHRVVVLAQRSKDQKKIERAGGFIVFRLFDHSPYGPNPWRTSAVWLSFLSYVFSRKRKTFSVVHCHDAETLPLGRILSRRDGAKLVYDAHELFFDYIPTGRYSRSRWRKLKSRVLRRIMSLIEKKNIAKCQLVLTVNSSLSRMIQDRYGLADPPVFLHNARKYVTVAKTSYLRKKLNIPPEGKILFYQGAIRPDREIERMVEILPPLGRGWFLVVAGQVSPPDYLDHLFGLADSLQVKDRFRYGGFLDYEKELLMATASADIGFFLLPPTNLTYRYSLANKLFDYVMAEIPMVVSDLPEMTTFIEKHGVGISVGLNRQGEIAETIRDCVENRAVYSAFVGNIRRAKKELCWERQEPKLMAAYQKLLS